MIHSENNNEDLRHDQEENLINKGALKIDTQNWDEREILARDTQDNKPQMDKRDLQANQEKRQGRDNQNK